MECRQAVGPCLPSCLCGLILSISIDIGGKLLTNQLKELASFRQWNMMDETHIVNDIKEKCCYVSTDFKQDMEASQYVKPQAAGDTSSEPLLALAQGITLLCRSIFSRISLPTVPGGSGDLANPLMNSLR